MNDNLKYLAKFLTVMAVLLIAAGVIANRGETGFRADNAIDFRQLSEDEVLLTFALSRRQRGMLKAGFLERYPSPTIALFGNHQVQYFSKHAFGANIAGNYFFNFWFANMGLPETRDYIFYAASIRRLPKKLVVVAITTPNNDNGNNILNYGTELPTKIRRKAALYYTNVDYLWSPVENEIRQFLGYINHTYNYISVLSGLFGQRQAIHVVNVEDCKKRNATRVGNAGKAAKGFLRYLPTSIKRNLGVLDANDLCAPESFVRFVFKNDGSVYHAGHQPPRLDENPLADELRKLDFGDELLIVKYMREIAEIVRSNDRKVVFLIPPVYETERENAVNFIFDKAIAELQDLDVIDHRRLRLPEEVFFNYDHPGFKYFELVVDELRRRGFIDEL